MQAATRVRSWIVRGASIDSIAPLLLVALLLLVLLPPSQGYSTYPRPPTSSCPRSFTLLRMSSSPASSSSSSPSEPLPPAPFVAYLTPGVPSEAAGLEAWYNKVRR